MKKITLVAILLAALAPMAQVWANTGGSTTYYAALKAQVSSDSSGMGKVYAGTSNSAGTYATPSSQSSNQSSTTQDEEKTFYAFAQANDGYEFLGWSTTENGTTYASTESPYSTKVKCSSSTESSPTVTTVYANFKKLVLASFNITFETSSAGSYTVDGAAPANKTGLTEATSVTLASSDPNFLDWLVNGSAVSANPYVASCTADTTIGAEFLTADQVTTVTTLSDLTSALSNAQYRKIMISSGTEISVPSGTTVSIPSGKQLVVDGTIIVLGTLSNSGTVSGNGTLYKISYKIDQGDVITVYKADGTECGVMECACQTSKMPRYCKTTVTANTPTVSGTIGCTTTWGVLLNGATAYAISKQSPKAVKVNVDTAKDANGKQSVVNKITSVVENGNVDALDANASYVLFADCSMTGPLDSSKLRSTAVVDCAGKKLSAGTNSHSSFGICVLNGTFSASASQWQNAHAAFFNVSSVSLSKIKGTGSTYYFYDCGTSASACSLSFTYYSSTRTSDYRTIYLYSGYYNYSFNTTDDSGKCNVYGGSYTKDPSAYIPSSYDGVLSAQYDGSKYYVVQEYIPPSYVCSVNGTDYESLTDAVTAAGSGSTITLSAAIELSGTLTIPAGKNITIALEKHTIDGGKIVNNGTLTFTDSTTGNGTAVTDASGGIVKSDIENNGALDFVFGSYTGAIVNKAGTLTTHNGIFSGTLTKNGGTVNLKGGHFASDVTSFVTANGYDVIASGNLYNVCELPDGTMYDTTVSNASGYGATPYATSDYNLMVKWVGGSASRTDYTAAEWIRLGELLCFYQLFNNSGLDPSLVFDRAVATESVNLYAKSGSQSMSVPFKLSVDAGNPYRALSEYLNGNGYASKTYKAIFSESISSVGIAVTDKSGNAGTVCKAMVELWESVRASDYSSTGHKITNTVYVVGQKLFTLGAGSNAAMIRPATGAATFYATPAAAMSAVADGGTVMLANDCDTAFPLTKAGTYTFDTMGFAHSDDVSVAEGLFVKSATAVDSSAKVLVTDAVAKTYVVAQKVASVGGTFYDNLTDAIANANGEVVTLLAATDETVTLDEGQSLKLAIADGVGYDTASKIVADPSLAGYRVKATAGDGYTLYEVAQSAVASGESNYVSIADAMSDAGGDTVEVTVTGSISETVSLDAGKTLSVTVEDGVSANVTVEPAAGAFIEAETGGATTTYVSKEITVEMAEPTSQAAVEVEKIENGETNTVSDASLVNAAIARLTGNGDVERTDNTDKLNIVDTITVTPVKIVQEVVGTAAIICSATFDVVPELKAGQSLGEGQKLKFRLPVDPDATQLAAVVYHAAAQFGVYPVQTYNGEKFIEVESADFSPYGYELLYGETANPVAAIGNTGYESLAAAISAASAGDTITLLADDNVSLTGGGEITINKSLTITGPVDANGEPLYTIYGSSSYVTYNDIFIKGSTAIDVTIENVRLSNFGDQSSSSISDVPGVIWVSAQTHADTHIVVSNVVISSFNYAAIKMYSGTLDVVDCLIDCAKTVSDATTKGLELGATATASSVTPVVNVVRTEIINTTCDAYDTGAIEAWQNTKLMVDGCVITNAYFGIYACGSSFVTGDASGDSVSVTITNTIIEADAAAVGISEEGGTMVPAAVAIQSGTFVGGLGISDEMATLGTIAISGGTFDDEVPAEYCADGYIPAEQDPVTGLYTVRNGAYVAQNARTGVKFETLESAVSAAVAGDTVTLLTNIVNFTGTLNISQSITLDGAGHSILAAPMTDHRNMFDAWAGGTTMFKVKTGKLTLKDITLDGDATHRYTFLVSADNSGAAIVTENVTLLHGGEQSLDADGATLTPGNGYGAAIHLNNGASLVVSNGFHACTGTNENGVTTGVFPFTAILPENLEAGTSVKFELAGNPNDPANVDIGDDMLLVGMIGDLIGEYGIDAVQGMLDYMQVPSRFIPYTLTLDDGSAYAFTGASPLGWNDIIDYGKDIMDVSTAMGFDGLDPVTTPVEVGLVSDTVLPDTFVFEDSNFTVNGNGNALSGTIDYTDDAGSMENIVLGTTEAPLVLVITNVTSAVELGGGIAITNVNVVLSEEQATVGTPVFAWDTEEADGAPTNVEGLAITLVDASGTPAGDSADLVWDMELGVAYIGPCEARWTDAVGGNPVYTSLTNAFASATNGCTVTLMTNVTFLAAQNAETLVFDLAGAEVAFDLNGFTFGSDLATQMEVAAGTVALMDSEYPAGNGGFFATNTAIQVDSGAKLTIESGVYVGDFASGGMVEISGGLFSEPVLAEYCAEGYFPALAGAGGMAPYTVTQGYAAGDMPEIAGVNTNALAAIQATFLNSLLFAGHDKATEVAPALANMDSVETFEKAAMLNIDITKPYDEPAFAITSVKRVRDKKVTPEVDNFQITVTLDRKGNEVSNRIYGVLTLKTYNGATWGEGVDVVISDDDFSENGQTAIVTLPATTNSNLFKAVIGVPAGD